MRFTLRSNGPAKTAWLLRRVQQPDAEAADPTWATWREALTVVLHPRHLRKTVGIALVVGTILFAINQLDVVIRHQTSLATYVKGGITYVVPFCVSNYGILLATRRTRRGSGDE